MLLDPYRWTTGPTGTQQNQVQANRRRKATRMRVFVNYDWAHEGTHPEWGGVEDARYI